MSNFKNSAKDVTANEGEGAPCNLPCRGPDCNGCLETVTPVRSDGSSARRSSIYCFSSVLSLRGEQISHQPLADETQSGILCWNGEAWKLNAIPVSGNDSTTVFSMLLKAARYNNRACRGTPDYVLRTLSSISGPFAFVFVDRINGRIYFGRDYLGRRSLLIREDGSSVSLSSVSDAEPTWREVEADGIYVLQDESNILDIGAFPQNGASQRPDMRISCKTWANLDKSLSLNRALPSHDTMHTLDLSLSSAAAKLQVLLEDSLRLRVQSIPNNRKPRDDPCLKAEIVNRAERGTYLKQPRLAILFSGGLDCTVLARMVDSLIPYEESIDLLNVAFENPRVQKSRGTSVDSVFDLCPDRITARASCNELRKVCPGRKWRLVEINVPYKEVLEHRDQVISLMYPHDTEMDLSIALALYFAARGLGMVMKSDGSAEDYTYQCPARVLLSGLGADELFGGYQRHTTALQNDGVEGLLDELELDILRLGKRNLGRDDRVTANWGKELRYPYLDEDLVEWAVKAPVWEKYGLFQESGLGSASTGNDPCKIVLRQLAFRLGMHQAAREKKRAIQFGARTAKMQGKSKGTDIIQKTV